MDKEVNEDVDSVLAGRADCIVMGKKGMEETKDISAVCYIAPIVPGGHIEGYYKVKSTKLKRIEDAEYPIRIKFEISDWVRLERPAKFGMVKPAYRGYCKTREEFFSHCQEYQI